MKKKIHIIGSGFSSIAASCYLAKAGYDVEVYEKNSQLGGRAQQFEKDGFFFDMGPTWYWMPDVFERFFGDFGKHPSEYYELHRLGPSYRVYFGEHDFVDVPTSSRETAALFESMEEGAGKKFEQYLAKTKSNYDVAIKDLVYKPGESMFELVSKKTVKELPQFFRSIRSDVARKFKNDRIRQILEFPVLFLGAKPEDTPMFYNFMNYADLELGTWYPKGGMKSVVDGMVRLGKELGVKFHTNSNVESINVNGNKRIKSLLINGNLVDSSLVLSGADYQFTESMLPKEYRGYSQSYWDKRTLAPSALLFFVGLNKKLKGVQHHTLFFDTSFDKHAKHIYDEPNWPENPLFYASFSSVSDRSIVPDGKEAVTFLIPLAPDLEDTQELRNLYLEKILDRLERLTGNEVKSSVLFAKSFCVKDFKEEYNSYKGNAYGMANTLLQTAFLRPKLRSKTLDNLFFTGQLTVPGPGVPPSLISGKLVSELICENQIH